MARDLPFRPPTECPVCGAAVPPRAACCPNCGADDRTGWNTEDTAYDGLDLPDSAFDDEAHSGAPKHPLRRAPHPLWIAIAIGLLVWFVVLALDPLWSIF